MRRLQRPCRHRGARGGGVGEQMRIGDELRRRREFPMTVHALAHETQEVHPFANLRRAPHIRFVAKDAVIGRWFQKSRYCGATAAAPKAT